MKGHLVKDIMTVDVLSIAPDSTLPEARRLMSSKKVRRLPVVDGGQQLVGIISQADIARLLDEEEKVAEVVQEISRPAKTTN